MAFLRHAQHMHWHLWKRGKRNGAWPGNAKYAIRQARVYVLDLDDSWVNISITSPS
jgi:hypothetical protein